MADESTAQVINAGLDPLAQDPKSTTDFSKEVEELLKKVEPLIKSNRVTEAIEELCVLEKKCRMASDAISCSKLLCKIVQTYYDRKDWEKVKEYLLLLTKKRGQLKRAISDVVQLAMGWIEKLDKATGLDLIKTLCDITDGKIFVEVERARLTKMLADEREAAGDIEAACDLIQEPQVETFGAMDKREKAEFILNQMRLVILRKDFIRAQIVSKKINPKLIETEDFQDIKLQYYEHLVAFHLHDEDYLNVAKDFQHIYNTPNVQEVDKRWSPILESMTTYLLLSTYDNEQQDLLHKLNTVQKKKIATLPICHQLVKDFLQPELMPLPLQNEAQLKKLRTFQNDPHQGGEARWKVFKQRVVQKNIRVIAKYYSNIRLPHLAKLLGITVEETETELCTLVCSKFLSAKIDRPAQTVDFGDEVNQTDHLNRWGTSIFNALELVEESCHKIQKEQMVHAARKVKAK